ncbi:acetyltransferase [Endozoicomonas sp. 2B-B]
MKNLVIFGNGEQAELAWFFFSKDSEYNVVAFVVDKDFKESDTFCDLPLITTDNLTRDYPPEKNSVFVAIGYNQVNKLRESKYLQMKEKGYNLASYVSSKATIWSESIGENCFILEDNTIQPFVTIGDNVTLWSGNHIGHHSIIEDHCFITSHVVISGGVTIGHHSFIGVNATLRDHIKVGSANVIGASASIMHDTENDQVYVADKTKARAIPSHKMKGI